MILMDLTLSDDNCIKVDNSFYKTMKINKMEDLSFLGFFVNN